MFEEDNNVIEFAQQFDPCARGDFIGVEEAAKLIIARDTETKRQCAKRVVDRIKMWADKDGCLQLQNIDCAITELSTLIIEGE